MHYDYLVVNDTVVTAAGEIQSILEAERCRTAKRLHLAESSIDGGIRKISTASGHRSFTLAAP